MAHSPQIIHIQPHAPPKPALGQPCNGCGVCCLAEPCPLGVLLSRKRTGACKALVWNDVHKRYWCGALTRWGSNQLVHPLRRPLQWLFGRWVRRWIAEGQGCDATLEVASPTQNTRFSQL